MTETDPRILAGEIFDLIDLQAYAWGQGSWFDTALRENYTEEVPVEAWLDGLANPACGTTACVAGWAVVKTAPKGTKVTDTMVVYPDGTRKTADLAGQEALSLTSAQADYLFSASRSREEVLDALESIRDTGTFDIVYYDVYDDYDNFYDA